MSRIESLVYTAVRADVLELYDQAYVTGSYTPNIEKFPCVYIHLNEMSVVERGIDTTSIDNQVRVVFTVEVYTDYKSQKKLAAETLFDQVNRTMTGMGFVQTFYSPTPNMDTTIHRITGRFKGIVKYDEANDTYRVYQKE